MVLAGDTLRVMVPVQRVAGRTDFTYDGVTAYLKHESKPDRPMLGVYKVVSTAAQKQPASYKIRRE